ncbi:unnamed protein product [Brachionus calyciflorus]|uniref:Uncharacterized protein n=1 Tax=Brachionus calyciflorus TaxID=104777 RepID=A0A814AR88_9BILA|nr:unnamed protein product [Brachionus calyciflorus]
MNEFDESLDSLDSGICLNDNDFLSCAIDSDKNDICNWIDNVFNNLPKKNSCEFQTEAQSNTYRLQTEKHYQKQSRILKKKKNINNLISLKSKELSN